MNVEFPKINNKLAFFDFDRTLVAHSFSKEYAKARADYFMDCLYSLTSLAYEHALDKPLPCMQWYTKKLFDEGYGLYCLTHTIFNLHDQLKQEQLRLFYPDTPMTYLTVDKPEHKIDMMKAVAIAEGCDLDDIIFVDDRSETVALALATGIDAKHLSDIVVMYEYRESAQQQDTFIKPKGFADFLRDDPTLNDEMSHNQINETGDGFSDEEVEKAYHECRKIVEKMDKSLGSDCNG